MPLWFEKKQLTMNTTIKLTGLALVLLFTQCGNNTGGESFSADMEIAPAADMAPARMKAVPNEAQSFNGGNQAQQADRKLIREGNMRFKTESVSDTRAFLDSLVNASGGYIANENVYNYEGTLEQSISVRIPSDKFDAFMANVSSFAGKLDNRYINTMDVTEEFIDVEARLKAKKELENRYLELLKQAKTVGDMVAIEGQLSQVRSEIESMQGRINYLQNRVSFASLSINFYQTKTEGFGFWYSIGSGFGVGWAKFLNFMVWTIEMWPFVLIIGVVVVIIRVRRNRRNS